jgi:hypothetical protein
MRFRILNCGLRKQEKDFCRRELLIQRGIYLLALDVSIIVQFLRFEEKIYLTLWIFIRCRRVHNILAY